MAILCGAAVLGLVLALAPAGGVPAHASDQSVLTVHLDNKAHPPARVLDSARTEIENVFRAAGVEVVWARRPGSRDRRTLIGPSREVTVMLATMQSPCGGRGCTLGIAVSRHMTAFVFVNRVLDLARAHPIDPGTVLGRVIAHEIGHLLLPPGRHSLHGLMQENVVLGFDRPSRFTADEARIIREGLALSARR